MRWYPVTWLGWFCVVLYSLLTVCVLWWLAVTSDVAIRVLLEYTIFTYIILLLILLYARYKNYPVFHKNKKRRTSERSGFTLVELLIAISIIAILARVMMPVYSMVREDAYMARAKQEFQTFHQAILMYQQANGEYPADANRNVPSGLEEYLGPGSWPDAAWPGSVFDWDNWEDPDDNSNLDIVQISVRFCPVGQPDECRFPKEDWAEDFDQNSAVYYCIQGACRSHINQPANHPGYCINCSNN